METAGIVYIKDDIDEELVPPKRIKNERNGVMKIENHEQNDYSDFVDETTSSMILDESQLQPTIHCEICGKEFSSKRNYVAHKRIHIPKEVCPICGIKIRKNAIVQHMKIHENKNNNVKFTCDMCMRTYNARHLLAAHRQRLHPEATQMCHICGALFETYDKMVHHRRNCKRVSAGKFRCGICNKSCISEQSLQFHKVTIHPDVFERYTCNVCGFKLSSFSDLLLHQQAHNEITQQEDEEPSSSLYSNIGIDDSSSLSSLIIMPNPLDDSNLMPETAALNEVDMIDNYVSASEERDPLALDDDASISTMNHVTKDDEQCTIKINQVRSLHPSSNNNNHKTDDNECKPFKPEIHCTEGKLDPHALLGRTFIKEEKEVNEFDSSLLNINDENFQFDAELESNADLFDEICEECGKSFGSKKKLEEHLKKKHGKVQSCFKCNRKLKNKAALTRHLEIYHPEGSSNCAECGAEFEEYDLLKKHMETDHFETYGRHQRRLSSDRAQRRTIIRQPVRGGGFRRYGKHKCDRCDKRFKNKHSFNLHKYNYHPIDGSIFVCAICGEKFLIYSKLHYHLKKHKTLEGRRDAENSSSTTAENVLQYFPNCKTLRKGVDWLQIQTDAQTFKCQDCDVTFFEESEFEAHFAKCTPKVECPMCGKRVVNITPHLKLHEAAEEKGSVCPFCNDVFKTNTGLGVHKRYCEKRVMDTD